MLTNYLKIVFRNLLRHKTFSFINIFGLAFGIAACLIIYLYVSYEKSYDTFNLNADNIYRLKNVRYYTSGTDSSTGCVALLGPTLKDEIPEVANFARLRKISMLVSANNQFYNEKNIYWADSSLLTMFSFPLTSGNSSKALSDKYSAVITISVAHKYFGHNNAMGKTIQVGGTDFKITGISEDVPDNSHLKFEILLSYNTQLTDRICWGCNNNNTYIQVKPGTKKSAIEAKLPLIVSKLHNKQKDGFERAYFLQPLTDIHLYSKLRFEHEENGNAKTINLLSFIALLILLIAWINYINLSTARSIDRAKEIGLRKVVGAGFGTLVRQFLLESFIINFIAVTISIIIVVLTHPFWNEIVNIPSVFSVWKSSYFILMIILVFVSPIIAGIYPAFILSSYSPVSILNGSFKNSLKGMLLRKGLVIIQFTISIILITAIIVFDRQISFMRNKNLGFNSKQKLVVNIPSQIQQGKDRVNSYNTFIDELKNQSFIENSTFSSVIPGMENGEVSGGVRHGDQTQQQGIQVNFVYVAQNYLNFFNIHLICGRNYYESEITGLNPINDDSQKLLINQSALKEFGFASPGKALDASIYKDGNKIGNIIGVINDYHQQSLDKIIKPAIFQCVTKGNYFIFNISTDNVSKKIEGIKNNFMSMFPGNPFEYNFLDEFFDKQYKKDIQTSKILSLFTILSIFISCLGLIGLSSLMTIQRTKEIGIRKVLGAQIQSLILLLTKEFTAWVLFANLIAWPIAFYIMNKWLQDFAYRIDISWWIFVLSGGVALIIALLTISYQAIKAATTNPIESLRYE